MGVFVLLLLVLVIPLIAFTIYYRWYAEFLLTVVFIGGVIALFAGMDMLDDNAIAGAILIGVGLFSLFGTGVVLKVFGRKPAP